VSAIRCHEGAARGRDGRRRARRRRHDRDGPHPPDGRTRNFKSLRSSSVLARSVTSGKSGKTGCLASSERIQDRDLLLRKQIRVGGPSRLNRTSTQQAPRNSRAHRQTASLTPGEAGDDLNLATSTPASTWKLDGVIRPGPVPTDQPAPCKDSSQGRNDAVGPRQRTR